MGRAWYRRGQWPSETDGCRGQRSQLPGILLKIASTFTFTCMIACLKAVGDVGRPGQQAVFFVRFRPCPDLVMVLTRGGLRRVRVTSNLVSHLWRGGVGAPSTVICARIRRLRLDLAGRHGPGLRLAAPGLRARRDVPRRALTLIRHLAVLLGFIGILFILWPQLAADRATCRSKRRSLSGAVAALLSAFFAASAMILVRRLIETGVDDHHRGLFLANSSLIGLATCRSAGHGRPDRIRLWCCPACSAASASCC